MDRVLIERPQRSFCQIREFDRPADPRPPLRPLILSSADPASSSHREAIRLEALARLFKARGMRPYLAVPGALDGEERLHEGIPVVSFRPDRVGFWARRSAGGPEAIGALPQLLAQRPDFVLLAGSRSVTTALLLGSLGVPVVMELSDVEICGRAEGVKVAKTLGRLGAMTFLAAREPEGILVDSSAARDVLIRRYGAHPGRVLCVDHSIGLPPARMTPLKDAVLWIAPDEPSAAKHAIRKFRANEGALLRRLAPGTRLLMVIPEGLRVLPKLGEVLHVGIPGLHSALHEARVVLSTGCTARHALVTASRMGLPICGLPVDAAVNDSMAEGMLVGISSDANVRNAARLLDDEVSAMRLGQAAVRAFNGALDEADTVERMGALFSRVRRAWVDPVQKLSALAHLPGRWPTKPTELPAFFASRARRR